MPCLPGHTKAFVLLFLLGSFVNATPVAQTVPNSQETLENLYARAQQAQRGGDYRAAAQLYQEMLKAEPHSAEVRANLGLMHHLLGEYAAAIREFRAALQEDPQLFVPNLFLGLDLLQVEKPREAVSYLERARDLNPHDANAVLGLGRAYTKLGDLLKARMSYNQAVRLNPAEPRAWLGLGSTYMNLEDEGVGRMGKAHLSSAYFQALGAKSFVEEGRLNDGIAKYRRLLEAQLVPPCVRSDFGFALIQSGKFADAEQEFQKELRDAPRCLMARLGLARIAFDHGDTTTAFDEISRVWQVDRNFLSANAPILWEGLGPEKIEGLERRLKDTSAPDVPAGLRDALLAALARWQKDPIETVGEISTNFLAGSTQPVPNAAAQRISQTRVAQFYSEGKYTACRESLKPALPRLVLQDSLLLAECAYDSGDFQTSFLASQQAVDVDAQNPAAWYWRIKASEVLAVNALVQAGLSQPNSPSVHVLLGDAYREGKKFNEAEAEYRKAIELKPLDVSAHFGLAATFYRLFLYDKALLELKTVLQLEAQNPQANFMMADILAFKREFAQAEPYAEAALHGAPSNLPFAHALLGKIYGAQGRAPEAIKELQQALPEDHDGSFHYQIAMLYKKTGDARAAREALEQSEALRKTWQKRAEETLRAVE
jgi:tetratricopeptide (TPR) repeat protein